MVTQGRNKDNRADSDRKVFDTARTLVNRIATEEAPMERDSSCQIPGNIDTDTSTDTRGGDEEIRKITIQLNDDDYHNIITDFYVRAVKDEKGILYGAYSGSTPPEYMSSCLQNIIYHIVKDISEKKQRERDMLGKV